MGEPLPLCLGAKWTFVAAAHDRELRVDGCGAKRANRDVQALPLEVMAGEERKWSVVRKTEPATELLPRGAVPWCFERCVNHVDYIARDAEDVHQIIRDEVSDGRCAQKATGPELQLLRRTRETFRRTDDRGGRRVEPCAPDVPAGQIRPAALPRGLDRVDANDVVFPGRRPRHVDDVVVAPPFQAKDPHSTACPTRPRERVNGRTSWNSTPSSGSRRPSGFA